MALEYWLKSGSGASYISRRGGVNLRRGQRKQTADPKVINFVKTCGRLDWKDTATGETSVRAFDTSGEPPVMRRRIKELEKELLETRDAVGSLSAELEEAQKELLETRRELEEAQASSGKESGTADDDSDGGDTETDDQASDDASEVEAKPKRRRKKK